MIARPLSFVALVGVLVVATFVPAERSAANEAANAPRRQNPDPVLGRIADLELVGGMGATMELKTVLEGATRSDVRGAALLALSRVGLRSEGLAVLLRRLAKSGPHDERAAAVLALGRVGDGRDAPLLIASMRAADGAVRSAGLKALRELTGRRLSASPVRCRLWWDVTRPGLEAAVDRSLAAVESYVLNGRSTKNLRTSISREGWVAVPEILTAARKWLLSGDHRLRAEAMHAIATLRLGDTVEEVEGALLFVNKYDAVTAVSAAWVLGLEIPTQTLEYAGLEDGKEPVCPMSGG